MLVRFFDNKSGVKLAKLLKKESEGVKSVVCKTLELAQ